MIYSRSKKVIQCISDTYPECEEKPISRIRTTTLFEVVQYLSPHMQLILSNVNNYFHMLVRTACTQTVIQCTKPWIHSINRSPFLKDITLRGESADKDIHRFCKIIVNDGFSHLRNISMHYMSDSNIQLILKAIYTRTRNAIRLNMVSPNDTIGISIHSYYLSNRICFAMADALSNSVSALLGTLLLRTNDVDGLFNFFKIVDLSDCGKLSEIVLSNCPLQVKGFELLIRSIWPSGKDLSFFPPIRVLLLENTQIHDCGILSLSNVMERGALVDLEELDLSSNLLKKNGIRCLSNALHQFCCPKLRILRLGNNFISAGSTVNLFQAFSFGACPFLSDIDLNHTGIGVGDIQAFAAYIRSSFSENLSRVNISNNPLITEGLCDFFTALRESHCALMKTLFLEGISISSKELQFFTDYLISGNASSLRNIILKSNLIDAKGFCQLMKALIHPNCPKMEVIDFSSNMIGNFEEEEWNQLIRSEGRDVDFEQIDYSFNPITDNDIHLLIQFFHRFSHLDRCKRLSFAGNAITSKAFEYYFGAFPTLECSLVLLVIDSCSISGIGPYLYNFLNSRCVCQLDLLILRDCSLTELDLNLLLDGLDLGNCVQLTGLRLDGNDAISDSFVDRLIQTLERNPTPNLYNIDCAYTSITLHGLQTLLQFLISHPYSRISNLDFSSSTISKEERESMRMKIEDSFSGHFSV